MLYFYEYLIIEGSFSTIQDKFLEDNFPNITDIKCDEYINYIFSLSKENIILLSNEIDADLLIEQTDSLRAFKFEITLTTIKLIIDKIKRFKGDQITNEKFCDDLSELLIDLNEKYKSLIHVSEKIKKEITPKIQWLGDIKVLTTLFFELLNGQEKLSGKPSTKKMLKCEKQDLTKLLVENFIDIKGNLLNKDTIEGYFNSSKPNEKSKIGVRIEMEIN